MAALTRPPIRPAGATIAIASFELPEDGALALDVPVTDCFGATVVLVVDVAFVGGATFARDTTWFHVAAAFALALFGLNGK
jgi:hypothetical protein